MAKVIAPQLAAGDYLYRRTRPDSGVADVPYRIIRASAIEVWVQPPFEAGRTLKLRRWQLDGLGWAKSGDVILHVTERGRDLLSHKP